MIKITYPAVKPTIRITDHVEKVFCLIRRKWMVLTPEEWVRQNFLLYLIEVLGYPKKLIAVEKQIKLAAVNKRFDIVVFDQNALPQIIVECKQMNEPISESSIEQVLRYNSKISAPIILITNGLYAIGYKIEKEKINEIKNLNNYKYINNSI
ncbi:MAG: type I restriction enzyme HsdR N-terminal domain-containing protein [Ferruginibacter sp.]|nr:type I restriction enzyme HsdR N-terminal domain-containing protein [Ferruginibacter sp.]